MIDTTREYYENAAEAALSRGRNIDFGKIADPFLSRIENPAQRILDIGCGCGYGLKYIITRGFDAVGIDYADSLVRVARERFGLPVHKLDCSDAGGLNAFIRSQSIVHLFASASLLHLPKAGFRDFMDRIEFEGMFFFSLKAGDGETRDENGRFFSYYPCEEVEEILRPRFRVLEFGEGADQFGREVRWQSWIVSLKQKPSTREMRLFSNNGLRGLQ